MPMATPEPNSSGSSRPNALMEIRCLVAIRYPPIIISASSARYSASSWELTEMLRTNSPRVPQTAMQKIRRARAKAFDFILLSSWMERQR